MCVCVYTIPAYGFVGIPLCRYTLYNVLGFGLGFIKTLHLYNVGFRVRVYTLLFEEITVNDTVLSLTVIFILKLLMFRYRSS